MVEMAVVDPEGDEPVAIDEEDVLEEIAIDEEELPDAEDEGEQAEPDDSIHEFKGHSDAVYSVACSPSNSSLVATGGGDDKAFLWNIGDPAPPKELKGHTNSVSRLRFSFSSQLLASGGVDGTVHIWDLSGALIQKLEGPADEIEWIDWHPRGHVILASSRDYSAWMWNAETGACLAVFAGHSGAVTSGGFTPDGKLVCTGSADRSLRVWNPKTGECIRTVQGHPYHEESISSLAIGNDSALAVTGAMDGSVCIVNLQNGRVAGSLTGHTESVESIGLSTSLPLAATGGMDGKMFIWDLQTLQPRFTCQHEEGVVKLLWLSWERIVTGCLDDKIRIWDARTGACLRVLHGHENSIRDFAVTCDERAVVSASDDGTSRVFLLTTGN